MPPFVGIDYQALPSNIKDFPLQLDRKRLSDRSRKPGDGGGANLCTVEQGCTAFNKVKAMCSDGLIKSNEDIVFRRFRLPL
ncbi:hypothetical protein [Alloprevotella tannerae]|uniref:hypothetical protein n=1 Tax=Alloprevotella tannerae TaxID=76122 RepID=UPI0028E94A0D|nr:hypothetical protein [Alloprevotella tannerae]